MCVLLYSFGIKNVDQLPIMVIIYTTHNKILYFGIQLHAYSQYMHVQPPSQVQIFIYINLYMYISSYFLVLYVSAWRHHQVLCFLARISALYYSLSLLYALMQHS
jgi:hypothetical protein